MDWKKELFDENEKPLDRLVDSYIDYIVRHNPEDFKNIAFVGTDIKYKF